MCNCIYIFIILKNNIVYYIYIYKFIKIVLRKVNYLIILKLNNCSKYITLILMYTIYIIRYVYNTSIHLF